MLIHRWNVDLVRHSHSEAGSVLKRRAADEHLGYLSGTIDYYTHIRNVSQGNSGSYYKGQEIHSGLDWVRGNLTSCNVDSGTFTDPLIVSAARDFIERQVQLEKHFLLYLPFHLVHGPNEVPDQWLEQFPAKAPSANITRRTCTPGKAWGSCRIQLGMLAALDGAVAAVHETLIKTGAENHTLVIFSSDNGAPPSGGSNFPLRGWSMSRRSVFCFDHPDYCCGRRNGAV